MNIDIDSSDFLLITLMVDGYIALLKELNDGVDEPEDITHFLKLKDTLNRIWKDYKVI